MADPVGAAAAPSFSNLSIDPSAPDSLSKNAQKKLLKLQQEARPRAKEEEKKKATVVESSRSQKPQAGDDDDMDPTKYFENRLKVLASLKAARENPYHISFMYWFWCRSVKEYGGLGDGVHVKELNVNLTGRIMNKRTSSSKLYFYDLYGGGAKVPSHG